MTDLNDTLLAAALESLTSGEFLGRPVIVTEIREPIAPPHGALVFWDDSSNEGCVIQPLYTDADRAKLRHQMLRIVEEQTEIKGQ